MTARDTSLSPTAALEALIAELHASGRPRVWSLVITLFGDAIVPRGGRVPLGVIQAVMARLGIEPGAVRTAMSRLAADRWVIREKDGRNSFYRLAEEGRHAFDQATQRIYAPGPPAWDGIWTIAVVPRNGISDERRAAGLRAWGFALAGTGTWIRPETEAASDEADALLQGALVVRAPASVLPAEPHGFWAVEEISRAYGSLAERLGPLHAALDAGHALDPLAAIAARSLLIHRWRRIVLRDPALPAALLPSDWDGEHARRTVRAIYHRLAPASETWLDQAGLPPVGDRGRFAARLGG